MAGPVKAEPQHRASSIGAAKKLPRGQRAPARSSSPASVDLHLLSRATTRDAAVQKQETILHLQRTIGNRKTGRLLRTLADKPSQPSTTTVQPKLTVGQPDDAFEREADAAASRIESGQTVDTISRLPAGGLKRRIHRQPETDEDEVQAAPVQRRYAACDAEESAQRQAEEEGEEVQTTTLRRQEAEEEEQAQASSPQRQEAEEAQTLLVRRQESEGEDDGPLQIQTAEEEEEPVQTAVVQRQAATADEDEEPVQMRSRGGEPALDTDRAAEAMARAGGGSPLEPSLQAKMEHGLGTDFSGVRVHTGTAAKEASDAINARAFTRGSDIYLGPGAAPTDHRLMAHELTHVVQQGAAREIQRTDGASGIFRDNRRIARQSASVAKLLQRDEKKPRSPDIQKGALYTFYLDSGTVSRVMAIQVGIQPKATRVVARVATLDRELVNPPITKRQMPISVHRDQLAAPQIVNESEHEVKRGSIKVRERFLEVQVSKDPTIPRLSVLMHYGRFTGEAPIEDQKASGGSRWGKVTHHEGWLVMTDGFRELRVDFGSSAPGSLWSKEWRPFVHPGLGYGFLNRRNNRFVVYPRKPISYDPRDLIRFGVHMIPLVGPLVMIGEALVGKDIWGRPLRPLERVILGAAALLSFLGPILRVGARVGKGAKAGASALSAASKLHKLTGMGRLRALRLIRGARGLTSVEKGRLASYAAKIKAGHTLAQKELTHLNRIIGKLEEPARIAAVKAELKAATGQASVPGRFTDLAGKASADEARIGNTLAKELKADVARVPESQVRTGDFLVDDVVMEAYSPRTANWDRILNQAQTKQKQAGTIILDMTHSTAPRSEMANAATRLFGRPSFSSVNQLIYIEKDSIIASFARSAANKPAVKVPVSGLKVRAGGSVASQAAGTDEE